MPKSWGNSAFFFHVSVVPSWFSVACRSTQNTVILGQNNETLMMPVLFEFLEITGILESMAWEIHFLVKWYGMTLRKTGTVALNHAELHSCMYTKVLKYQYAVVRKAFESKCTSFAAFTFLNSWYFRSNIFTWENTNLLCRRKSKDATVKFFYQRKFENCYPIECPWSLHLGWKLQDGIYADEMWCFKFIVPYFPFKEVWKF